ncbi:hypothetical protein B0H14DRAFT_2616438 [Mycena olivaceomarginata]|nr:hypothetical protein B0H14DRAFT_2616438 [Mycena olivaceomarginata]
MPAMPPTSPNELQKVAGLTQWNFHGNRTKISLSSTDERLAKRDVRHGQPSGSRRYESGTIVFASHVGLASTYQHFTMSPLTPCNSPGRTPSPATAADLRLRHETIRPSSLYITLNTLPSGERGLYNWGFIQIGPSGDATRHHATDRYGGLWKYDC